MIDYSGEPYAKSLYLTTRELRQLSNNRSRSADFDPDFWKAPPAREAPRAGAGRSSTMGASFLPFRFYNDDDSSDPAGPARPQSGGDQHIISSFNASFYKEDEDPPREQDQHAAFNPYAAAQPQPGTFDDIDLRPTEYPKSGPGPGPWGRYDFSVEPLLHGEEQLLPGGCSEQLLPGGVLVLEGADAWTTFDSYPFFPREEVPVELRHRVHEVVDAGGRIVLPGLFDGSWSFEGLPNAFVLVEEEENHGGKAAGGDREVGKPSGTNPPVPPPVVFYGDRRRGSGRGRSPRRGGSGPGASTSSSSPKREHGSSVGDTIDADARRRRCSSAVCRVSSPAVLLSGQLDDHAVATGRTVVTTSRVSVAGGLAQGVGNPGRYVEVHSSEFRHGGFGTTVEAGRGATATGEESAEVSAFVTTSDSAATSSQELRSHGCRFPSSQSQSHELPVPSVAMSREDGATVDMTRGQVEPNSITSSAREDGVGSCLSVTTGGPPERVRLPTDTSTSLSVTTSYSYLSEAALAPPEDRRSSTSHRPDKIHTDGSHQMAESDGGPDSPDSPASPRLAPTSPSTEDEDRAKLPSSPEAENRQPASAGCAPADILPASPNDRPDEDDPEQQHGVSDDDSIPPLRRLPARPVEALSEDADALALLPPVDDHADQNEADGPPAKRIPEDAFPTRDDYLRDLDDATARKPTKIPDSEFPTRGDYLRDLNDPNALFADRILKERTQTVLLRAAELDLREVHARLNKSMAEIGPEDIREAETHFGCANIGLQDVLVRHWEEGGRGRAPPAGWGGTWRSDSMVFESSGVEEKLFEDGIIGPPRRKKEEAEETVVDSAIADALMEPEDPAGAGEPPADAGGASASNPFEERLKKLNAEWEAQLMRDLPEGGDAPSAGGPPPAVESVAPAGAGEPPADGGASASNPFEERLNKLNAEWEAQLIRENEETVVDSAIADALVELEVVGAVGRKWTIQKRPSKSTHFFSKIFLLALLLSCWPVCTM